MPEDAISEVKEILERAAGALTPAEIAGRMSGGREVDAVTQLLEYLRVEGAVRHQQDGRWTIAHRPL